jgi:hypothetical protein
VSEAPEASAAFHLTPPSALRFTYLYYFLHGRTTLHESLLHNGPEFTPGSLSRFGDAEAMRY